MVSIEASERVQKLRLARSKMYNFCIRIRNFLSNKDRIEDIIVSGEMF